MSQSLTIEVLRHTSLRIFLDLNETLIRTGEADPEENIIETDQLNQFVELCKKISRELGHLDMVFLTGNSFEYSRRIEEPLGIKNIPEISLTIVSENGLIARNFDRGDLWRASPSAAYGEASDRFLNAVASSPSLAGKFYTQGNEIRLTLKPVANEFTSHEITELHQIATREFPENLCKAYSHKYYFDLDPTRVLLDGVEVEFAGKYFATSRIIANSNALNLAVGDSPSDIPMFKAVVESGGTSFWVKNASSPQDWSQGTCLTQEFTAGVNELLSSIQIID